MYQSLHTTVIGPSGRRIEIQIRTSEMDRVAEEGVAAHWRYKEGANKMDFDLSWVKDLVETQAYLVNPDEFIQSVKSELFPKEVFVFTPKGRLIRLAARSTPVDFAYSVHSDVGHQAIGAKVNGSIVPLSYRLENGDTIEILTSKNHVPSKDWLDFVQGTKARQKIRSFLKLQERDRSREVGQELLDKELKKFKATTRSMEKDGRLQEVAKQVGYAHYEEMYVDIGYGKLACKKIIGKLFPESLEEKTPEVSQLQRIFKHAAVSSKRLGVKVSGIDDMVVRFAKCCEPIQGDRIAGFITRGRGVTVHRADCSQVMSSDPQRKISVSWDESIKTDHRVKLIIISQDQRGLLAKVTKALTDAGGDIRAASIITTDTGKAEISFELSILDAKHLEKVTRAIEMVPGIIKVTRVQASKNSLEED
jgi:GTP pyrophosphokinase